MQDLAKKMHVQQEVLDRTVANIAALEKQNVELVNVLEIVLKMGKICPNVIPKWGIDNCF
jgi:hypothetical protein